MLMNLHELSDFENIEGEARKLLKGTEQACDPFKRKAQKHRHSKVRLLSDRDFSNLIYAEMICVDQKLLLEVINVAKYLKTKRWLQNVHL